MSLPLTDPARYADQLADKLARFQDDFSEFALPAPAVFASAAQQFRMRAEFRIWHSPGRLDYAMFEAAEPKKPVLLDDFPVATEAIRTLMPRLREALMADPVLARRLFQVEFLATLSGERMVTLVYHRPLDEVWTDAARGLADALGVELIGRSRGQKVVLGRDWLLEAFELDGRLLRYRQPEGGFTQPNAGVNRQMLAWARHQAAPLGGDLLELYCGNGNFTVALAPLFGRVLATEMSKTSVAAARYNLEVNGVDNVAMVRMASDEISAALARVRPFRRMKDIALDTYRFSTLFVDPPRAGLDEATLALAAGFDNILYISCNPATLRDNVRTLQASHRPVAAALFDQFPYTRHLECGLLLQRRA